MRHCKKLTFRSDGSGPSAFGVVSSRGTVVGNGRTCTLPLADDLAESPDMSTVLEFRRKRGSSLLRDNREAELCKSNREFDQSHSIY